MIKVIWVESSAMVPFLVSLLTGAFGASLLYLIFRLLRSDWPTSYSDMKTVVDSASQRNIWLYVAMRFIPVYVVSVLVASIANTAGGNVTLALVACAVLHTCVTNLRPSILRKLFRNSRNRPRYLAMFFSSLIFLVLAPLLASTTWSYWKPFLPQPDQLVQAIWTSLFVGLVVVLVRTIGKFEINLDKHIELALDDLGEFLQKKIRTESQAKEVSREFIEAIVLTECIQRPKWIRRAEHFKGRFVKPGTYGVAQFSSSSPISDEKSIEEICKAYAGYHPVRNEYGSYNRTLLQAAFESHNPDPIFVVQATEILEARSAEPVEGSSRWASDGRKFVEVTSLRREGQYWVISLTHYRDIDCLRLTTESRDGIEKKTYIHAKISTDIRIETEVRLSIEVCELELTGINSSNEDEEVDSLTLDLEDPYIS